MSVAVAAVAGVGVILRTIAVFVTNLAESGVQPGNGGREVLEEIDFVGKLDEKCLIGRLTSRGCHHLIEEHLACGALVVEGAAHRTADVYQEPEREGQVIVAVKIAYGLLAAVDCEFKVVFVERGHESAALVTHDDGQVDELSMDGEGGRRAF